MAKDKKHRVRRLAKEMNLVNPTLHKLKARYYELAYSIEMPAELSVLKRKLVEGKLTYQQFMAKVGDMFEQDPNYAGLKELEREILSLDKSWLSYLRNMPEEQVIRILDGGYSSIKERIIEN